jgi:hypothetical protein
LFVPLPKKDVEAVPFFFDLWASASALNTVPDLELTDEAFAASAEALSSHIATFMDGDAWDVARWTAFQFTQDIVQTHLRRADVDAIRRAGEAAHGLIDSNKLLALRSAVGELQRAGDISAPEEYQPLVGTKEIPSFFHLVVAYALSVGVRGCSYAYGLAQHPASPIYRHHWIRSPALRYGLIDPHVRTEKATNDWIPWGTILRNVFDRQAPETPRLELERVLTELRARTPQLREALTRTDEKANTHGISQDEQLLIETLLDAGIAPRYADTRGAEKLAVWLRDLVGHYLPLLKIPVELVTSSLQPQMFRSIETKLRLTFRRDTFWDVMEDPGVRKALRTRVE